MNEYIINPAIFYLCNTLDTLKVICIIFTVCFAIATGAAFVGYCDGTFETNTAPKKLLIATVICLVLAVFVPSRTTIIEMTVASLATKGNVELTVDTIKELIQFVAETLK